MQPEQREDNFEHEALQPVRDGKAKHVGSLSGCRVMYVLVLVARGLALSSQAATAACRIQ
jgi:hypothetical protein